MDNVSNIDFLTLIDSGSSDNFMDKNFVIKNNLSISKITPLKLRLLDGSTASSISETVSAPIHFASGEIFHINFYVTTLDSSCSAVLGYSFLSRYNPLIDWAKGILTFQNANKVESPQCYSSKETPLPDPSAPDNNLSIPATSNSPPRPLRRDSLPPKWPFEPIYNYPTVNQMSVQTSHNNIALIGAAAFVHCCKDAEQEPPVLRLSDTLHPKLSSTNLENIPSVYHDFADIFDKGLSDKLAQHCPYDLKIELEEGSSPTHTQLYHVSDLELDALKTFIDENIRRGFIAPSNSPYAASVLFVKKKSGELRLCVDYRALNKITKKDRYPLPLISELLDSPRRAKVYTKLDLRHAYHLVQIAKGDEWKTAFRTHYGSFEWRVMPFGLTNTPAAFQCFVNDMFADLLDVTVIVYLDDVLIYSDDHESHKEHVREVLRRLRANGLFANPKKCEFNKTTVEYLGYILSPDGLRMSMDKVQTILDWPTPRKVKDVQSFLGFCNFYRRFIHQYSDIVVPLTCLTHKAVTWKWDDACETAFNSLRFSFTTAPVLAHWLPNQQIIVETDALDYAVAAILSLRFIETDEIHPIAFHSRTLHSAELNYDTHNKELLAIFEAFTIWRHYLEGSPTPVDVVTDHKNLEYFSTTKILTWRQVCWSEYLSAFNMVISFRLGKLGAKPDALARRWDVYPKEGDTGYAKANPQNFRPVFTQEQLITSLRATFLEGPTLRASIIMDIESTHSNIRHSYTDDSDSVKVSKTPNNQNQGGLLMNLICFVLTIGYSFQMLATLDSRFSDISMTILYLDTLDKIALSRSSDVNTHGPEFVNSLMTMFNLALLVVRISLADIAPMDCLNRYRFRFAPGTQSLWTSSKSYPTRTGLTLS